MATATVSFDVCDVSRQRRATVRDCPADASIGEVLPAIREELDLPETDASGNPISHALRRDSDGAVLYDADVIGDVVEPGGQHVMQPSVDAGGR